MSVGSAIRTQLARRAPSLEDRVVRANWRLRNRGRSFSGELPGELAAVVDRLRRDGVVITDFDTVFGGQQELFDGADALVQQLYAGREQSEAEEGGKGFLTKLASGPYALDDPFPRVSLHPRALAVANAYLRLKSTLRSIDLWHTRPTPGPATETQLWHRDADDVMNVKMFVYFTDVTKAAGPLCYAPRTHPLGSRRDLPERDEKWRSTDEQLARIVPGSEWVLCEGIRGTVVFADTCGYHKQLKPAGEERLLLVSHYVSGTPYVPRALELTGADAATLTDEQFVAVHDRTRS
jgi:hypothetical protein